MVDSDRTLRLQYLPNRATHPGRWELAISDIQALRRQLRGSTERVAGTFHSHPVSEPVPSLGDLAQAPINSLMLVYDVCGRAIALYRILGPKDAKRARKLALEVRAHR